MTVKEILLTRNILDYASAGHIPAYLLDSRGKEIAILRSTGIPLGYIAGETYSRSEPIALKSVNILALLTDGISEAQAKDENEFGFARVIDVVKTHRKDTAKQITDHLTRTVCLYTGQQHQEDDLTSVICKVN